MPYTLEFPRALRAIEMLVGPHFAFVYEFVAFAHRPTLRRDKLLRLASWSGPGLPAVVRALDDLPEPTAGLGCINPVGIDRRTFQMVHFPPGKMRTVNLPFFALFVGRTDKS